MNYILWRKQEIIDRITHIEENTLNDISSSLHNKDVQLQKIFLISMNHTHNIDGLEKKTLPVLSDYNR